MNASCSIDAVASIRLNDHSLRPKVDRAAEKLTSAVMDVDIDALDAEFQRLSNEFKSKIVELREHPENDNLRQELISTNGLLSQMRIWSSLVSTAEGLAIVKKNLIDREILQRKYQIDQILKISKAQSAMDLCFLMDCTGSMRSFVQATKSQIRQLTERIVQLYSIKPRLAFVGYRDINEPLDQLDFTTDEERFEAFLHQVQASGGDDTCEDVFGKSIDTLFLVNERRLGGLEVIGQLSWSNPNRVLVHICDAPCHGQKYHEFQGRANDNYLAGDPKHRDLTQLIFNIKRLGITYCKISLNETTKKMFEEFSCLFGSIAEIHVQEPEDVIQRVIETSSAIIQSRIHSSLSSFHNAHRTSKDYTTISEEPQWSSLDTHAVDVMEILPLTELSDLFHPLQTSQRTGQMKIAAHPFARGSLRYAFYGQFSSAERSPFVEVVYKELASVDTRRSTLAVYREHLEIQAIAQFLAEQFNLEQQRLFRQTVPIVYADADLVQRKDNPSRIYQVERRMHEEWRKWNNNSGGVSLTAYSTILQAFSHWTYEKTAGRLMVVDLQGVKSGDTYLLTDPALHCDDLLRFRATRTNLGVKGMQEFFRTHLCSEICSTLKLTSTSNASKASLDPLRCQMSTTMVKVSTPTDFETIDKNQIEVFELC